MHGIRRNDLHSQLTIKLNGLRKVVASHPPSLGLRAPRVISTGPPTTTAQQGPNYVRCLYPRGAPSEATLGPKESSTGYQPLLSKHQASTG